MNLTDYFTLVSVLKFMSENDPEFALDKFELIPYFGTDVSHNRIT